MVTGINQSAAAGATPTNINLSQRIMSEQGSNDHSKGQHHEPAGETESAANPAP